MIKKPTLFVLLGAIILGAAVYFFDWKRSLKEKDKPAEDASKPAFTIATAADIQSVKLTRPGNPAQPAIQMEKRGDTWEITQPLQTEADQLALEQIASELADARVDSKLPGTPDRLKVYGLDPPAVSLEFRLANGATHSLKLGGRDFTGMSVYGVVDGAPNVALLPQSLLGSTEKSVDQLRDHSVLHIKATDVMSFVLKNASGEIAATKDKDDWKFSKPASGLADATGVQGLLNAVTGAKLVSIASETPDNLAKYGLTNPAITFTPADSKGRTLTLAVGKKDDGEYFARDLSRPLIFRITENVYKSLAENYTDLRDKRLVHFDPATVNRIELRNANGTMACTRKSEEEWTMEIPADQKGKSAGAWKILSPFTSARAEEIIDHPSGELLAKLAKPPVEASFTDKTGKTLTVRFSKIADDFVYAQTSDGPAVYKLKKQIPEDLSFKPSDLAF
jgi:Domain of unknown function (DUF4340)